MIYQFIEKNKFKYTVEKMCKVLKVSKNAYYNYLKTKDKKLQENPLKKLIKEIFLKNNKRYGSIKIKKTLEGKGYYYSVSWVAKLMKQMNLRSIVKKKFIATTDSKHQFPVFDNKLNRNFKVTELGKVWVSDITYIKVNQKWYYLTTIMDLADRQILSYSISDNLSTKDTILKAWYKAREVRDIKLGFIFHSDRGVQYASKEFTSILLNNKYCTISMSRKGNCWDNAVAESFFKTIKCEYLNHHYFKDLEELKKGIFQYINWYNIHRIHQSLDYLTPKEMEKILLENYKNCA